jgi:hypothetical protein
MPSSIAGSGTTFLGQRNFRSDGSYVTTEFITAIYLPLVPIRSFRVIEYGSSHRYFGPNVASSNTLYRGQRIPLCWPQVAAVYATVGLCLTSLILFFLGRGTDVNPGPLNGLNENIAVSLAFLSATWPLIAGLILRALAKRRAGWEPKTLSDDPALMKAMKETHDRIKQHKNR